MFLSNLAANTLGGVNREGHAQSTTHAAVSDGTLTIRDKDNQQQHSSARVYATWAILPDG
ncbi:hypothetical protein [Photorhabdus bodei]|nr:hypothetical protein [Photorhabdus bodei]NDL00269.1 hypothetical protein [Photorhabdus bodei]NDL08638.1 hypothetical protein [Photorhabdus bodei]